MSNPITIPGHVQLNAHQLRKLADMAESMRGPNGDPVYVLPDPASPDGGLCLKLGGDRPGDTVFAVSTTDVGTGRGAPSSVTLGFGDQEFPLLDQYDAVFWSESAVEKFVLPYYASKSMWDAASVLTKLSRVWYGKVPCDKDAGDDVEALTGYAATGEDLPVALAHTPDSDWGTLPMDEFHGVVKTETGFVGVPLSELHRRWVARASAAADPGPQTPAAQAVA